VATVATVAGYVEICRDVEMSRYVVHRCAQYVVLVASAWQEPDASAKERRIMTNRHNIALRRLYHSRFVKSRWTQFPPIYIYCICPIICSAFSFKFSRRIVCRPLPASQLKSAEHPYTSGCTSPATTRPRTQQTQTARNGGNQPGLHAQFWWKKMEKGQVFLLKDGLSDPSAKAC